MTRSPHERRLPIPLEPTETPRPTRRGWMALMIMVDLVALAWAIWLMKHGLTR
jgi:hypothetical protein